MPLSISIVINTLNRGSSLNKTLESLQWIKYDGQFEVIVVNGPSTDNSDEIISNWLPKIRAGKCDVANLSISRNIGICMAQGDIVAFIDDDAIPEPEWLTQLADAYCDPMVGAVGGFVYNHTGYDFQYKYCLVDRFGNADLSLSAPTPHLSFPKSGCFPHLLGCNSSFRRSALLEIGGFDEEFEYFLDETDVCLRIVDAGYIIAQLPNAYVHHKYAPSNIRGDNKVVRFRYPIIKNKIYFMLKHAKEFYSMERIMQEQQSFIQSQRNDVTWCHAQNFLSDSDVSNFDSDLQRALEVGLKRGIEGVAHNAMINNNKLKSYAGNFVPFSLSKIGEYKSLILVSRDYPPNHGGGIATFTKDLAESLAGMGNIIHVITESTDIDRVDFEHGVWVHRMKIHEFEAPFEVRERKIPQHIWNWSATALEEAKRIATHRQITAVEAPIWDCEGIAFLLDGNFPLVTSLQTTLHFWLQTHPENFTDSNWMESFGNPMLKLEQEVMQGSNAIRSISRSISSEIETAYNFKFEPAKLFVLPLGLSSNKHHIYFSENNNLEILFVGRLELRKGIDIFLEALPVVLEEISNVKIRIIGDNSLVGPDGLTFMDKFKSKYINEVWFDKVFFEGRVDQNTLLSAYQTCDIFVAPSRFESFGLILLEAMREGKPVIGCNAGGMPEIISHGVNGLLVEPGNAQQLTEAILQLAINHNLRQQMGEAGKKIFEEKFTAKRMAQESAALYDLSKVNFSGVQ